MPTDMEDINQERHKISSSRNKPICKKSNNNKKLNYLQTSENQTQQILWITQPNWQHSHTYVTKNVRQNKHRDSI